MTTPLSVETARQLLDFTGGDAHGIISPQNAEQQLRGAVATHNLLARHNIAYLADEVGMGKTYVALGAIALFRHFNPSFRVLVIAPRENIQDKWMKEWRNFVRKIVRVEDLCVKTVGGAPARSLVKAHNLVDLIAKASRDHDRDYFARLTSFSIVAGAGDAGLSKQRDEIATVLPWIDSGVLSMRSREEYQRNVGRAVNCAVPHFDLLVIDEAHNLKAGWSSLRGSARNAVLGCALGGKEPELAHDRGFQNYSRKAGRVLFLSATPVEQDFRQLWNQLDLLGHGAEWAALADPKISDEAKREIARQFLIRRVGSVRSGEFELTKNQYRREWRGGGAEQHDHPMSIPDDRQRLAVALVQKKVSELLGHSKHNHSFQIGLLASFESFSETARAKKASQVVDDGPEDADSSSEFYVERGAARADADREGMDIDVVNRIARDYQRRFNRSLPHPKMDSLVRQLSSAFTSGRKSLVFVRRVASVDEIQRKLEECYDDLLFDRLRSELNSLGLVDEINTQIQAYHAQRNMDRHNRRSVDEAFALGRVDTQTETSNTDSFFAWFFRGLGPEGVFSGARLATRFDGASGSFATFFEDNHTAAVLGVTPKETVRALADACGMAEDDVQADLRARVLPYLKKSSRILRREAFEAFQRAALELIAEKSSELRADALAYLSEVYSSHGQPARPATDSPDPREWLEVETLFTVLLRPERAALRSALWPDSSVPNPRDQVREREHRRMLLATMVRKGHAIIDLFTLVANSSGTIIDRKREDAEELTDTLSSSFLDLLERQHQQNPDGFHSYAELSGAAENFELIMTQNIPELREQPLSHAPTLLGRLLRSQRPVGGMAGTVNKRMVRQFRMPGYPLVLVSTDLLAEGEDLHTFCSNVVHYGIAWMPSALEQRVGRIDRVGSQTERRLGRLQQRPAGAEKLQVFYPHLRDTVEVLQVQRVLGRLNRFLRLMHSNLGAEEREDASVDVKLAMSSASEEAEAFEDSLVSAFGVSAEMLAGEFRPLSSDSRRGGLLRDAFVALKDQIPDLDIKWTTDSSVVQLTGMRQMGARKQPFALLLRALRGMPVLRCVSPIGDVRVNDLDAPQIRRIARAPFVRISALHKEQIDSYELAAEGDIVWEQDENGLKNVSALIRAVTDTADAIEDQQVDQNYDSIEPDIPKEVDVER